MKGKLLIIFKSVHGYVRRYVDILGNALGCDAVPLDKFRIKMHGAYDKLLYIGSVRGSIILGFDKLTEYLDDIYQKLVVCGVGMLPYRQEIPARLREGTISISHEKEIPVFYAQGGFDLSELSRTEKMNIAMVVRKIRAANIVSEDDTVYLNAAQNPMDEVSQKNIQPLIDFFEGKQVDESLYCPPSHEDEDEDGNGDESVSAPDEQPTDAERAEMEEKKRELKRKLKK